jgi:hypothetical protein
LQEAPPRLGIKFAQNIVDSQRRAPRQIGDPKCSTQTFEDWSTRHALRPPSRRSLPQVGCGCI